MAFVEIYPNRVKMNASYLRNLCAGYGVEVVGVTKVTCGDEKIASAIVEAGVKTIGESRIENIIRIRNSGMDNANFMLLRPPQRSRVSAALDVADVFLVSDLDMLGCFMEAPNLRKYHRMIYMIDTGDLREGVWYKEAIPELEEAVKIAGRYLAGIGTNLGCYGGVLATPEKFEILLDLGEKLYKRTGVKLEIYSAGNTASLPLIENNTCPEGINQFRLGESIVCGTDVTNNRVVPGTRQDTFILYGEIIELKTKPSVPEGEIGRDAFGRIPVFEDKGPRLRAILDMGELDVIPSGLTPLDSKISILHASSDHLIVDLTESSVDYKTGDIIAFKMSYGALLRVMTSRYIEKVYRWE
ncbi:MULTISPECIES: alanine racemase [unclassified Kosmotoga]|jgi:predicted amino acid racemase|uniref:alanine racemase n=1 Tax=unclassified Kosmotoga TaxID=2631489 RepID=UPI0007C55C66|nr:MULTISPECIES: alanine/ornithine racemase family PLP-dependent enzyme [unclassified Kosmotoga]MDI3523533.1 ornithine racemase [Kosmotoga sp.]MDK2953067.1 ornithine racemase [Kosmotoga sp.]OAA20222.1 alanine racemase [Kosmotoga sp. DU53]